MANELEVTIACRPNDTDPDLPPNINVMVDLEGPITGLVDSNGNLIEGSSYSNEGYMLGSMPGIEDPSNTYPDSSHFSLTRYYVYLFHEIGNNVLALGPDYAGRNGFLRVTGTRDIDGRAAVVSVEGGSSETLPHDTKPPSQTNIPVTLDENGTITFTTEPAPDGDGYSYLSAATLLLPGSGANKLSLLGQTLTPMLGQTII